MVMAYTMLFLSLTTGIGSLAVVQRRPALGMFLCGVAVGLFLALWIAVVIK